MRYISSKLSTFAAVACLLLALSAFHTSPQAKKRRARRPAKVTVSTSSSSPYGVNAHIPSTQDFKMMRRAGISWARVDFTWDVIEPRRGVYRWDISDRVVMDARTYGVNLLAILGYCPPWASTSPPLKTFPPRSKTQWSNFVKAIVGRYKGRVRYWTLWNEPNSETFFRGSLDSYINEVLIPGSLAARKANPNCRIVGPDLAHLGGSDWYGWLDNILKRAGGYIDVISHHCYKDKPYDVLKALDGKRRFWEKRSVRSIMKRRHQSTKPFWLTEVGWRSTKIGEQKQAGYEIALLKGIARRPWISKVFIFELKDSPGLPGYGLLKRDGKPKPAYTAYQGFIASISGKKRGRKR